MPPPEAAVIPGLPYDIALQCLARVPRRHHPTLSLVSRSWRRTLLSPSLFAARRLLRLSEPFLYLNLRHHSTFHWYVLINKPNNTQFCLVPLPSVPIGTPFSRKLLQSVGGVDDSSSGKGSLEENDPIKIQSLESSENSSARNGVKIRSLGKIESCSSSTSLSLGKTEPSSSITSVSSGEIEPCSSGTSLSLGEIEPSSSGTSLSLGQIEPSSSGTSTQIQSLESTDASSSSTSIIIQSLDPLNDSSSRNSIEILSLDPSDDSLSHTSLNTESLGTSNNASASKTSIKLQPFGLSHLLNAPKRQPIGPSFAVVGSSIYLIGGSNNEIPSNGVWVFDCRFNVWEEGPRMRVGREFSAAGVVDGKIYVMGGCVVDNWARSKNWAEVFDPSKGLWEPVPSPIEVRDKWMHASAVIGGKMYAMADRGGVVYDARKGEWGSVTKRLDLGWRGRAAVVGGVLYCYDYLGKIRGYVVEDDRWKELRGVDKGLPKFLCGATMVNFDGRLCVVWEGKSSGKEVGIMCAMIEVKKDVDGGLSGEILWSDVILAVPHSTSIVQCLVVEL